MRREGCGAVVAGDGFREAVVSFGAVATTAYHAMPCHSVDGRIGAGVSPAPRARQGSSPPAVRSLSLGPFVPTISPAVDILSWSAAL